MTTNHTQNRQLQKDARAWATFTGTKYTTALREISSPLAQGLLGDRVSARRLISVLDDHEVIGARGGEPLLGEYGMRSETPWQFNGATDFLELSLIVDMLRMFSPVSDPMAPAVGSYSLKHTAERFLSPHCSYVSNGRLIWAAAALGLPISDPDGEGPNVLIGLPEREHDYVSRMVGTGQTRPKVDHHRPAGYEHLRNLLTLAAAGQPITGGWVRPEAADEPAPFHDWLVLQADRDDAVGTLAGDYVEGVRTSDHRVARTPDELLAIFHEVSHSPAAYDAVVTAITEWMRTMRSSDPIRTERIGGGAQGHEGWGAGAGTVERYEYLCPCGDGEIIEEHDNIPGFRDHDRWIDCDKCRAEWRFVDGSVRGWGLEPVALRAAV
jgi:hypothetical protein